MHFPVLRAKAERYLTKDEAPKQVVEAMKGVAQGQHAWMSRRVAEKVADRMATARRRLRAALNLSERELEVLGLMSQGLDNREIASEPILSEWTAKNYAASIDAKLGVPTRQKTVASALRHGIGRTAATDVSVEAAQG